MSTNQKSAVSTAVAPAQSTALVASLSVEGGALTVAQIKARRTHIKAIMKELMEDGVHFGIIKGTDKPTLLKPGAELLMSTFQIDGQPQIEDLSSDDCIRYRVILRGIHSPSGISLGHGVGECSTDEEKYKWRTCRGRQEWDETPEDRTRVKYEWNDTKNQVRTNPADAANTVLKMAKKRAQSDMVLTVLAVSDIFLQDAEEMADWLRGDESPPEDQRQSKASSTSRPAARATAEPAFLNEQQLAHLRREIDKVGCGERPVLLQFNVDSLDALPFSQLNAALKYVQNLQKQPPQS